MSSRSSSRGFTLIEVMVVVAIVGILAGVAYSSYIQSVTKTRRTSAQGCMLEMAQFMERFYTTNMRYDQTAAATPVAVTLANTSCRSEMAAFYTFSFTSGQPTQSTYTIQAVPQGRQATADAGCGTLTLTQAGTKGRSGTTAMDLCWQ